MKIVIRRKKMLLFLFFIHHPDFNKNNKENPRLSTIVPRLVKKWNDKQWPELLKQCSNLTSDHYAINPLHLIILQPITWNKLQLRSGLHDIPTYILVVTFFSSLGGPFKHLPVSWSSKHITIFSSSKKYKNILSWHNPYTTILANK